LRLSSLKSALFIFRIVRKQSWWKKAYLSPPGLPKESKKYTYSLSGLTIISFLQILQLAISISTSKLDSQSYDFIVEFRLSNDAKKTAYMIIMSPLGRGGFVISYCDINILTVWINIDFLSTFITFCQNPTLPLSICLTRTKVFFYFFSLHNHSKESIEGKKEKE